MRMGQSLGRNGSYGHFAHIILPSLEFALVYKNNLRFAITLQVPPGGKIVI